MLARNTVGKILDFHLYLINPKQCITYKTKYFQLNIYDIFIFQMSIPLQELFLICDIFILQKCFQIHRTSRKMSGALDVWYKEA